MCPEVFVVMFKVPEMLSGDDQAVLIIRVHAMPLIVVGIPIAVTADMVAENGYQALPFALGATIEDFRSS
ncbi:MAG: hypothetical protein ACR2NS_13480 [Gemmatimonadaceae bacterium]